MFFFAFGTINWLSERLNIIVFLYFLCLHFEKAQLVGLREFFVLIFFFCTVKKFHETKSCNISKYSCLLTFINGFSTEKYFYYGSFLQNDLQYDYRLMFFGFVLLFFWPSIRW